MQRESSRSHSEENPFGRGYGHVVRKFDDGSDDEEDDDINRSSTYPTCT